LQSFLNDKSNCNLKAAQLLHEHERYAAVPHCAYYACLQQIKYILCVKFQKYCNDNELRGRNTHVVIMDEFLLQIRFWNKEYQFLTKQEIVVLKTNFETLKSNRISSDYNHQDGSSLLISKQSLRLAFEFTNIIQKIQHD
jgi:hypothetical protein